jgi:hypothetical protein
MKNQNKILPVVGIRRKDYNIWGLEAMAGVWLSRLSPNGFIEGLNGDQFFRKKKLHVLFDHRQVLDLCGSKRLEIGHDLLDQHFGC